MNDRTTIQDRAARALAHLKSRPTTYGHTYIIAGGAPDWMRDLAASVHNVEGDHISPFDPFRMRMLQSALGLLAAHAPTGDARDRLPVEDDRHTLLAWFGSNADRARYILPDERNLAIPDRLSEGYTAESLTVFEAAVRWLQDGHPDMTPDPDPLFDLTPLDALLAYRRLARTCRLLAPILPGDVAELADECRRLDPESDL